MVMLQIFVEIAPRPAPLDVFAAQLGIVAERADDGLEPFGMVAGNRNKLAHRLVLLEGHPRALAGVKRQFIVKVNGAQSVSMMPSSGAMASLAVLGSPLHQRLWPLLVRNR